MEYVELFSFIEKCCEIYGIDASHGIQHSKGCVEWVQQLFCEEPDMCADEKKVAIYAAALHDMCDKKYTNPVEASERIRSWLLEQGWSQDMTDAVIQIVTSMSYSSLKKAAVRGIPIYPDLGKWQKAYHLARHADLLDAYRVGRCFLYTQHIYPGISDDECWRIVEELFNVRIFRYVQDGWIAYPKAIVLSQDLERDARRSFLEKRFEYSQEKN